ncbi:MAG TPA: dihydrodipicolinate synthase family protein, partial [Pyrinomonadaceae bacterium]|nr:dihydrodipicolinate synthase family protein [Pyrinomonadaceae bacterium]
MTLQVDWLRGCATALVTPFTNEGAVDDRRLRDLIEYQLTGGVKVLVPCGTTGESVTMSDAENELVIRTTIELARGRGKVIAGTGSNSTATAIQKSRAARALGADGVLCVAPYYNK